MQNTPLVIPDPFLEWDWADRLTKVTSNGVVMLENWYDASSRRIAKWERVGGVVQRWWYLYDGWEIVAVLNENGQLRETFTRGVGLAGDIGTLVAVTHHAGSTTNGVFYAHHNHRGDVTLVRRGTVTVATYDYSAFGTLKAQTGADVCRFKFSYKERDASTGFYYYGYRFYAPQWQRWPNRDPIEEEGGSNLYAFIDNLPLTRFDPFGLEKGKFPPIPGDLPGTPKKDRNQDWVVKCMIYCDALCMKAPNPYGCTLSCYVDYCDKQRVPDPKVILKLPTRRSVFQSIKYFCKIVLGLGEKSENSEE